MKHAKGRSNVDDHISWILPKTREECVFSASTMLSVSFIGNPSTSHIVASASVPTQSDFFSSSSSVRLKEQIVIDQTDV